MFGSHATELSVDQLEQVVESASEAISGSTAVMLTAIRALDTAQVATADGSRSMAEWLAGRFDLEASTARSDTLLVSSSCRRPPAGTEDRS